MKYAKNVLFIVSLFMFFNTQAYAIYCSEFYIPDNQIIHDFGNVQIPAGASRIEKNLSFHHIGDGVKAAGLGNNYGSFQNYANKYKRYWVVYPNGVKNYNGISISVTAGNLDRVQGQYALAKTNWATGYRGVLDRFSVCNSPGEKYWFLSDMPILDGVKLEINRGNVLPGRYDISIPFALGAEENSFLSGSSVGEASTSNFTILLGKVTSSFIRGSVDVNSSCHFKESQIDFNFGDVTLAEALAGVKRTSSFSISCTNPARVKLSVKGGEGKPNETRCGSGICTVPIGGGSASSAVITVSTSRQLSLEASFRTNEAFSGKFNGSLVLSMEII